MNQHCGALGRALDPDGKEQLGTLKVDGVLGLAFVLDPACRTA
jgi:hypothetical protein